MIKSSKLASEASKPLNLILKLIASNKQTIGKPFPLPLAPVYLGVMNLKRLLTRGL